MQGTLATILSSVLVGGVLVMFLEMQHLDTYVTDRYFGLMKPFYRKLSAFCCFLSFISPVFMFESDEFSKKYKGILKRLGAIGGHCIVTGHDVVDLSPAKVDEIRTDINLLWYYISENPDWYNETVEWDYNSFSINEESVVYYLDTVSSKYTNREIDKDAFFEIVGDFDAHICEPIKDYPHEFKWWRKQIEMQEYLNEFVIIFSSITLACIVLIFDTIPLWLFQLCTTFICILFTTSIICLGDLSHKSKQILR